MVNRRAQSVATDIKLLWKVCGSAPYLNFDGRLAGPHVRSLFKHALWRLWPWIRITAVVFLVTMFPICLHLPAVVVSAVVVVVVTVVVILDRFVRLGSARSLSTEGRPAE